MAHLGDTTDSDIEGPEELEVAAGQLTKSQMEEKAKIEFEKMRRNYKVIPNAPEFKPFEPIKDCSSYRRPKSANSATFDLVGENRSDYIKALEEPQCSTCRFCYLSSNTDDNPLV